MEELFQKIKEAGFYSGDYQDFKTDWGNDYEGLHSKLSEQGYYTGDLSKFNEDYPLETTETKIEDQVEPVRTSVRSETRQRELKERELTPEKIKQYKDDYNKIEDDIRSNIINQETEIDQQKIKDFEKGLFKTEEREEYDNFVKTGEIKSTKLTEEEIKTQIDNAQNIFLQNVSDSDREKIYSQELKRDKEIRENVKVNEQRYIDNKNSLESMASWREENINNKTWTQDDENEFVEKYNSIVKSSMDIKNTTMDLIKDIENNEDFLDNWKRSYNDLDKLENTLLSTGTDILIGVQGTIDMFKDEEGKEKSNLNSLVKYRSELAKISEEELAKPISVEDIKDVSQLARWAGDAIINFVPSGMMLFTGSGALPLFFASGYGGRLSEFELEKKKATETIPKLQELLEKTEDPLQKKEIQDEIDYYNKALSTSDLKKFLTSSIYGTSELLTEKFTTLRLFNKVKGINGSKAIQKFYKESGEGSFGEALKKSIKSKEFLGDVTKGVFYGPGLEGLGEGTNQLVGNITDRYIVDKDVSLMDGVPDAAAQGALIGNGFSLAKGGIITRAALLDVISTQKDKAEQGKIFEDIANLTSRLDKIPFTEQKTRQEILKTIKSKLKEANLKQDYSASAFIKLPENQKKEVFELDRKSHAINNRWVSIVKSNADLKTKEVLRDELQKQFNNLQDQKRKILEDSKSLKLKDLSEEKLEGLSEGDQLQKVMILQTYLNSVNQHNKNSEVLDKQVSVTLKEQKNIEAFLKSETEKTLTLEDGSVINKKDAEIFLQIINEGAEGGFVNDVSYIVSDVAAANNPYAPLHEYTHGFLKKYGFNKKDFDKIKNKFDNLLKDKLKNKEITKEQHDEIFSRLKLYNKPEQSEELLVLTGDALALDILKENENTDFSVELTQSIKNFLNRVVGKEEANNFNIDNAENAFNLIKTINKNVLKDRKVQSKAATEPESVKKDDKIKFSLTDRATLFEAIQNFVPKNIKTKEDFNEFLQDPRKNRPLFDSIYNEGGAINNYIIKVATTPQESEKIIDNIIQRILNFDPQAERAEGGIVGIEGFTERVMSDVMFSKLDAKKELFKESEKAKQEQQLDSPQAAQVAAEEVTIKEPTKPKQETSKLRRILDIKQGDNIYNLVKKVSKEIFNKELPDKKLRAFINKKAKDNKILFKDIADFMGKEKAIDEQFLNKNILNILNTLPASDLIKIERGSKQNILAEQGPRLNVKDARKAIDNRLLPPDTNVKSGPRVAKKLPVTLEQAKEFFNQKRKAGLVGVLVENLTKDAAPEVTKELVKEGKMTEAKRAKVLDVIDKDPDLKFSKSLRKIFNIPLKGRNKLNALLESKGLKESLDLKTNILTEGGRKKILDHFKYMVTFGPKEMWVGSRGGNVFTTSGADYGISMKTTDGKRKNANNKYLNPVESLKLEALREDINNMLNDPTTKFGKDILDEKGKPIDYKISSYKTLLGNPKNADEKNKNGDIKEFNNKVSKIHKEMWKRFNKAIKSDKNNALKIATYLKLVSNHTGHWHKMGATIAGWSTDPKGKKGTTYEYEHAMPATAAYLYLLDVAIDKGNFEASYKAVMDNYKLIALDALENDKLGKAGLSKAMPKGWFLGDNFWWQRYFNSDVALIEGGILPSSIVDLNGITFADKFNIDQSGNKTTKEIKNSKDKASKINNKILPKKDQLKGKFTNDQVIDKIKEVDNKNKEEAIKFSKSLDLNKDFNDIIESKTGIASEKVYAKVKAQVAGASKGRFKFFVPPSAEDFVGLLYTTLAEGKLGNSQMAWYKAHLLDPYARAMNNINSDRLTMLNDYKALKKQLKIVPKNLRKKLPGEPFTKEQAVRVYIWNKQGMEIPGLSKADLKELTDYVEKNSEFEIFANQLIAINKGDGYAAPKEYWTSGNIASDLLEGLNTTKRAKYLELWQQNVDQIFSEANLNKLEAAYGRKYREALEGMLQRMKTGRNRINFGGADGLVSRFTDWLTNSIGAIMFFNTRSAVLQTISMSNYINFRDNNPLAAAKALLNVKQYSKDFIYLMNSDLLKARRAGLRMNVSESDIADMAKDPSSMAKRFIAWTLKKGFIPTQFADSFAIASGGATFYRNRINKYIKEGMNEKAAEKQAFLDFQELTETSQQSSRPDKISKQQAGPLGRIILAFANTPMQYTREIKKAALDLKNGRGDVTTNISKILYYGILQNLIFNALQQALFAIAFDEDEEEEKTNKRYFDIANSMSDQFLRGIGVYGAVVSTMKNTLIKLNKEMDKKSPKYNELLIKELAQVSPPLGSKIRKLDDAGRAFSWNKKEIKEKGFAFDNPAYLASANIISALTNVPADRAIKKISNISNAMNTDLKTWQRVASFGGWSDWQLGINKPEKKKKSTKKKGRKRKVKYKF